MSARYSVLRLFEATKITSTCKKYLSIKSGSTKDDKKIQDAHEAIRPTYLELNPLEIKDSLSRDQLRLYQLIFKRFLASQMSNALYETTSVKIDAGKHRFTVAASKVKFDGFMSVYTFADDENCYVCSRMSNEMQAYVNFQVEIISQLRQIESRRDNYT